VRQAMIDAHSKPLLQTTLPGVKLWKRGKVRDVYDLGDRLLVVATDRLSAFDVVLPTGIPGKGVVLTQMSLFWFGLLQGVIENHVVTADVAEYDAQLRPYLDQLAGRSMIVVKTEVLPVECVVRGYLAGSGWKDYKAKGAVCGVALPPGLRDSDRLQPAIFTPATKAETGHDENIPFETMEATVGREPRDLLAGARARRGARDHPCGHEVRVRGPRRATHLDRRGPDAGLVALLAARRLRAGPFATQLRQAVRARLPRDPELEQAAPRSRAAAGRCRANRGEVRGGLRAAPRGRPLASSAGRTARPQGSSAVKQQLEALVTEMVDRGILFSDAKREFEKRFIARVLQRHKGNLSRAAQDLKIHRNTLGKKIEELKIQP